MSHAQDLTEGLRDLSLVLSAGQQQQLLDYVDLLRKWNKVYNLTAVRDPAAMITYHLLDSLAITPHMGNPSRIADVGSGPGLPGIPLAIMHPDWHLTLLDSNHKKTTFLRQAAIELGLANVEIVCERVERYRPTGLFQAISSRAFSDLAEFARLSAHLLEKDGKLYAMKGVHPHEELAKLPSPFKCLEIVPLQVPGLGASRHLVVMGTEET